ncbi:hypothetical protein SVIOM342S_08875 [Streptomyces violaceorubidus]
MATLSTLVPVILVVSFVIGDAAGTAADFLPDRAGQIALYRTYDGTLGALDGARGDRAVGGGRAPRRGSGGCAAVTPEPGRARCPLTPRQLSVAAGLLDT